MQIFHAASWNLDWTRNELGDLETYDGYITFANHVRLTSSIRPIYGFTGAIPESLLSSANLIDKKSNTVSFFGTGLEKSMYTCTRDLAAYSIEAISEPQAAEGGYYRVESFRASPREMADIYDEVRGTRLNRRCLGSLDDLEYRLARARAEYGPCKPEAYVGLAYAKFMLDGTYDYDTPDSQRWASVKQTSFKDWLLANPDV
jgi:hypothetical protein